MISRRRTSRRMRVNRRSSRRLRANNAWRAKYGRPFTQEDMDLVAEKVFERVRALQDLREMARADMDWVDVGRYQRQSTDIADAWGEHDYEYLFDIRAITKAEYDGIKSMTDR